MAQQPLDLLRRTYTSKIQPLEQKTGFAELCKSRGSFQYNLSSESSERPLVLVLGQYSTGKTTLLNYILGRPYPGQVVSAEPTTDSFVLIQKGIGGIVPGQILASTSQCSKDREPFAELAQFAGEAFLNRFRAVSVASDILDHVTLLDTPGILSGGNGSDAAWDREYDFVGVMEWFIERAHRVLVIFDAYKLDVSVEMSQVLQILKNHQHKTRLVLNKADAIQPNELLRVYGALLWRLGKLWSAPEVVRAYVVSMWDNPIQEHSKALAKWFLSEEHELIHDLSVLHLSAPGETVKRFVGRLRQIRALILLLQQIQKRLPNRYFSLAFFSSNSRDGMSEIEARIIMHLKEDYSFVMERYNVLPHELPDLKSFISGITSRCNISKIAWQNPGIKGLRILDSVHSKELIQISDILRNISTRSSEMSSNSSLLSFNSITAAKRLPKLANL
jgi:GTP-binding protein EngB required for normal cell division